MVCGGRGLIGERLVAALLDHGSTVTLVDLPGRIELALPDVLATAVHDGRCRLHGADLGEPDAVDRLFGEIEADRNGVDGVVNATYPRGPNYGRAFDDVDPRDFVATVGMQTGSYFAITQRAVFHMRPRGTGSIVNLASIYGSMTPRFDVYEGTPMTMPVEYAVSKAGLVHFTRYVAKCTLGSSIRINCVSPGGVADGTQPDSFVERYRSHCNTTGLLDRDALSATVVFLLSDGARHITGQDLVVDDGFSL